LRLRARQQLGREGWQAPKTRGSGRRCSTVAQHGLRPQAPPVRITPPDGTIVDSEQANLHHQILSKALNREETLHATARGHPEAVESASSGPRTVTAEEYWPNTEGLDHWDTVTGFVFLRLFDCASEHLLTTAHSIGCG
jgi:hypothetical protein